MTGAFGHRSLPHYARLQLPPLNINLRVAG